MNIEFVYSSCSIAEHWVNNMIDSVMHIFHERELLLTAPQFWINQLLCEIGLNISLLSK